MNQAKHTPGPWDVRGDCDVYSKGRHVATTAGNGGDLPELIRGQDRTNALLISSAPDLLLALQAQEVASDMQKQLAIPSPDDPRYTPYIGPWDGYRAPEVRFMDFHLKRKLLRRTALAKAMEKGEEKEA